ncbi:pentatricopeptide repeat-containing protein 2, mitochondrial-like [Paramacrobiotus metropolitanus]|uniref:pentatricopeptide repeat-containing protein 2, mitochondrial-like n=1 Tax=Paramacrobiotus metropolitanus TaxID=2943436 RepID=UPI002445EF0F|nr:pentatricopeptide repeat-containing protein 2, mitochondrial-like [Paramacrobiotus metropolitanus]
MTPSARWIGATWRTVAGWSCVHFNCAIFRSSSIVTNAPRNFSVSACQRLFTKDSLGLSKYEADREATAADLGTMQEHFRRRMEQYLSANSRSIIVTVSEDLKKMCYLAQDDKDLEIVNKMLKKYVQQYGRSRAGSFVFGPLLMRLHYHLNKPDAALASIRDPVLAEVYDQLTSYMLAMDLLYKHQRYDYVVQLYKAMLERPFFAEKFPRENLALACAACYKLGTPEAYATAREWMQGVMDRQAPVMRKAVAFAAALALKNNDPAGALELLSLFSNQSYMSIRNLRVLALTRLGRLEQVLPILGWTAAQDSAVKRTGLGFFQDVIGEVKKAVAASEDAELRQEFERTFAALDQGDPVDAQTLDEFLERPFIDSIERAAFQSHRFENERHRLRFPSPTDGGRYGASPNRQDRRPWSPQNARYGMDGGRENRRERAGSNYNDDHYFWDPARNTAR